MTFCMCVSLYGRNKPCVEQWDCRNRNYTFYVEFCRTPPNLSLHSDIVRVSVVLDVASQLSKLWRITGDLLANRKRLNEILWSFCIRLNCD